MPVTVVARAKANITALRLLRRLQEEQRPATSEEQAVLARWSGWGATPQLFVDSPSPEFAPLARELRSLLSDQEWEGASDNTLNAHYTDPQITQAVWEALRDLGFDGGEVLEPGAGSGNFIGYAPPGAHMTGVELDPITAGIAKALYPHADIRAEGFEKTRVPDATFDATVGNVPFGAYEVVDLRHNKGGHRIHNHFILKSLDLTRPGGIVAVVTSRYTMDGSTVRAEDARMEMARKADLLGAIRLPSGAHRRSAGTDVVTDLLIFRRRDGEKEFTSGRDRKKAIKPLEERGPNDPPMWVHSAPAEGLPGQDPKDQADPQSRVFVNPYFTEHPNQVLGQMAVGHGLNRANELRVDGDGHLAPALTRALKDVADRAKANGLAYRKDGSERRKPRLLEADSDRVDGHVQVEPDGTFTQVRDGQIHPFDVPKTQAEEARALLGLRDVFKQLVAAENAPENDEALIERLRADLKARYDEYHRKHGAINRFEWKIRKATDPETGESVEKAIRQRPPRGGLFTKDPTMAVVKALDTYDAETGTSTPASIFTRRAGRHRALAETADSPQDAAVLVQERMGWLDLDELAKVMNSSPREAKDRLLAARSVDPVTKEEMPLVFELPGDGGLEMAADYLSGNVRTKLNEATAKAGTDPRFQVNVQHLEQVLPPDIPAGEIDAPLGASWLGAGPVQAFLNSLMDEPVKVEYQGGSLWKIEASNRVKKSTAATETWGTADYHTPALVEAILTNRKIQVRRQNRDGSSYIDVEATDLAKTKAEELSERFQEWLWEDPKRAEAIKKAYNDTHNNLGLRSYDGQRRTLPGLAEHFRPHDHQHAAVARMVNEPAVLLAHEVGAGKTAEMAMGVMELRRLGLANKPVIVVPGHMLQQFHDEFLELYPDAKLMAAGSDDLTGRKRREFIARVAATDCDAVILTQRAFESIDMQAEVQLAYINREKEALKRALARAKGERNAARADGPESGRETRMVKEIRKRLKNLEAKIEKKTGALKDKAGLSFEATGIDYIVVDEAHHYKNLATNSSIPGAGIEGSNRASDLDMKLDYLRSKTKSGRVVTFATATPISNSVTEAHTMLRYLRPDLLEQARIRDFDEFASTYGKIINGVELAPDGSGFREVARFAAFRNMPELLRVWRTVADVKTSEDLNLDVPDLSTGRAITVKVEPTEAMLEYQASLARRAAAVKSGLVDPSEDNMLKISSDGRKVSLDPRMVGIDEQGHKLSTAADNIHRIYAATKDAEYPTSKDDPTPHPTKGGLQIVFLDMGTPQDPNKKKGKGKKKTAANLEELDESPFPAYAELKALLAERGIPEDKIRFIHEAKNDAEKARLFADARSGKIAVLVGSTTKMGVGTNVQLRATALHHLDCPWRPADLEQRNGRIIRQGNANPEVSIYQYVTEQSFDGFSWQTVARKAKFIRQLMKGSLTDRTVEDIPDGVFNAEQVTALATGNPYLLEQANVRASLAMLTRQHKAHLRAIDGARATIRQTDELRDFTHDLVAKLQAVSERKRPTRGDAFNATFDGKEITSRKDAAAELARLAGDVIRDGMSNPWGEHPTVRIGELGGIDVTAKFRVTWSNGARHYVADISMPDVPGSKRAYTLAMLDGVSLTPITRLEDSLADTEANIEGAKSALRREERNAAIAAQRLDKPFEKADELGAIRERSRLVNAIITAQSKAPSGDEKERAAQRQRVEALEHELRQARIRAGESPEEADDPAAMHDQDVMPRTPAPPVITTDAAGRTTVSWPDREARKAERKKAEDERVRKAAANRSSRDAEDQVDLAPEDVQADLDSIGASDGGDNAEPAADEISIAPEQVSSDLGSISPAPQEGTDDSAPLPAATNATPEVGTPDAVPAGNKPEGGTRPAKPHQDPAQRQAQDDQDAADPAGVTLDRTQVDADLESLSDTSTDSPTTDEAGGGNTPDSPDSDSEAPEPAAPAAGDSHEPSDWAKRVTITRDGNSVVVTDTGFGPHLAAGEELRAWMKDPNNGVGRFHYRPDDKEWRYNRYGRQKDADPAAAEAALRQKIEEIDRQQSHSPATPGAAPAAGKAMKPTPQQDAILRAGTTGETIAVTARAGTGKTSTLKMLARALPPDKKIMYLAFGRKVAADARQAIARGEFPPNVEARTANSMAATSIAPELANKLGKTPLQSNEVRARLLGITDDLPDGPDRMLTPEQQAGLVMSTINRWVLTADPEITIDSFPGRNRELFNALKPYIDKAWADISDPNGKLRYDYDYSVKHWALSDPKINADIIFWDEAQDINPVLEGVVRSQGAQVVLVGDPGQSIFEFRGTSNALNSYPVDRHLSLNQSWRFGPKVADLGNRFLALGGETPDLEGNPKKASKEEHLDKPDAVLVRTNVGAIEEISAAVKAGRKPAVLGGTNELKAFLSAAERLKQGRAANHPDLAGFSSWDELEKYVQEHEDEAGSLRALVDLVNGDEEARDLDGSPRLGLRELLSHVVDENRPHDVIIGTVHKAKGAEWPTVRIGNDFPQPRRNKHGAIVSLPSDEDMRLNYVAVTRAEEAIDLGSLDWVYEATQDGKGRTLDLHAMAARRRGDDRRTPETEGDRLPDLEDADTTDPDSTPAETSQSDAADSQVSIDREQVAADLESIGSDDSQDVPDQPVAERADDASGSVPDGNTPTDREGPVSPEDAPESVPAGNTPADAPDAGDARPPAQLTDDEIDRELADLTPKLGEEEDPARAAREESLTAEREKRRRAAGGDSPNGPGGTWAEMQREEGAGEGRGLFGADALQAAQPQDREADAFGTPDMFADAEGRESRVRADRLKPGDRYVTDDGTVAEVDTAETVGRGSVKVRSRDGRTLYHRADHRFRRASDEEHRDADQTAADESHAAKRDDEHSRDRDSEGDAPYVRDHDGEQDRTNDHDREAEQHQAHHQDDESERTDEHAPDDSEDDSDRDRRRRRRRRRRDSDGPDGDGPGLGGPPLTGIPLPHGLDVPAVAPTIPEEGLVDVPRSPLDGGRAGRVAQLRNQYRSRRPLPGVLDDPRHRRFLRELAKNPTLTTSTGGNLVLWSEDDGRHWRIAQADMGVAMADPLISEVEGTVDDARRIADQYESIKDADGHPFPWDAPDPLDAIATWKDSEGHGLAEAMRAIRSVDRASTDSPNAVDGAAAGATDLTNLPDEELEAALQHALESDPAQVFRIMREMDRRDGIDVKLRDAGLTDNPPATDTERDAERRAMDAAFDLPRAGDRDLPRAGDNADDGIGSGSGSGRGRGRANSADETAAVPNPVVRRAVTVAEQDAESYEQWVESVLADLYGRAYGDAAGSGDADFALRGGTGVTREGEELGITAEMIIRNQSYGRAVGDLSRFANDDLQPLMSRHGFPLSMTAWMRQRRADRARDRDLAEREPVRDLEAAKQDVPGDADRTEAVDQLVSAAPRDVVPGGNSTQSPRFRSLEDVRAHFTAAADRLFAESGFPEGQTPRAGGGVAEEQWNTWHRAQLLRTLSTDPTLGTSDGGRLVYVAHQAAGGRQQWRIYFPGSGETSLNPYTRATSKEKIHAVANAFEAIRDEHGQPVPWDSPDFTTAPSTWRDADGRTVDQAMLHAHASLPGASQSLREQDQIATNTVTAARHWQEQTSTEGFTHELRDPSPDLRPGDVVRFEVQFWRNEPDAVGHRQYQYETDAEWLPRSTEPGGPYDDNQPAADATQYVEVTGRVGDDGQLSEAVFRRLGDGVTGPVRNPQFPRHLSDSDRVYAARRPRPGEPGYDASYQLPPYVSDAAEEAPRPLPDPIGGRPAEWTRAVDLLPNDVARVEGTDQRGRPVTRAGFVLGTPESVTVTRDGRRMKALRISVGESPDGTGKRHLVIVPRDGQAARAAHPDTAAPDGAPLTGAQADALAGRLDGRYPTDSDGNAVFPGGLVADANGTEGLVTGVTSLTASVRWSGDRDDEVVSPSTVRVTDAGAARPAGWTLDGQQVEPGQVAVDRENGRPLGVVDAVDGDAVTVLTPDGPAERDAPSLRVADRQGAGRGGATVVDVQEVAAEDLEAGDVVLLDDGGRPTLVRVTSAPGRRGDRVEVEYEEVDGGAQGVVEMDRSMILGRPTTSGGSAAELTGRAARTPIDDTRVESHPVRLDPVDGHAVDPGLSTAERDRVADLALGSSDEPEAEQGAARIASGLPLSAEQADAVADVLEEASGSDADGRVAARAARRLREAAGHEPASGESERPVPGTASDLAPGDVVAVPSGDDEAEVVTVTDVQPGPAGTQVVTTEDATGERAVRVMPSGAGVWQLPDPANMRRVILPNQSAAAPSAEQPARVVPGGNNPAPAVSSTTPSIVPTRVASLRSGDVFSLTSSDGRQARVKVVAPPRGDGRWTEVTVADESRDVQRVTLRAGRVVDVHERAPEHTQSGTDLVTAHAWGVVNAVIETALDGVEPGSIHALRQAVAERLTPQATRSAERRAAYTATQALEAAGLPDAELHQVQEASKVAAKKAREAAVRAALRTLNDLEPLDGESEEDTATRAAALLHRIPDVLDVERIARAAISRPYATPRPAVRESAPQLLGGRGRPAAGRGRRGSIRLPSIGRVHRRSDQAVVAHVDTSIAEALRHAEEAVLSGTLTEDRADEIVRDALASMATNREAVAREIIDAITAETGSDPTAERPGLIARIMATLVRIAKRVGEILKAVLRKARELWTERDERLRRFRERLVRRIRWWPESQRLREEAAAAVEGPEEGADATARFEHWAALVPQDGRFGQAERPVRSWRRARRRDLAAGRLPELDDRTAWVRDRSADGGPGPVAMRHLAAVRGAGEALDADVAERIAAAAPDLGSDARATVAAARAYERSAGRRADRVIAAARAGDADAAVEEIGARMEAEQARAEARRVEAAYGAALAEAAVQALTQVRPMGAQSGAALQIRGDGEGANALREAERFLPADWLEAAGPIAGAVGNRESYDPTTGRLVVAGGEDGAPLGVALHGLAHHLQQSMPELPAAEEAYHFVRTSTGRIGARRRTPQTRLARRLPAGGHNPAATSRPGGWENLFSGAEPADGRSWEVLPTGLEGLFSGSWYLDDDLRQFLLGMLGTLGRRS